MSYPLASILMTQPRRQCRSISGMHVLTLVVLMSFVTVMVRQGVSVELAAGSAVLLFGVLLGRVPAVTPAGVPSVTAA
ncbi:hypothetical protein [Amycolatopsis sp. lyj-23]|uniref:hypothetical protein n=1 Tax=Amycolatopsis sp. lyj-23 TaxID=2789283 RepID=UPI00397DF66E